MAKAKRDARTRKRGRARGSRTVTVNLPRAHADFLGRVAHLAEVSVDVVARVILCAGVLRETAKQSAGGLEHADKVDRPPLKSVRVVRLDPATGRVLSDETYKP